MTTATNQHMTYSFARLQKYKKKYPSYWRDMVKYAKGYTRYSRHDECPHHDNDGKLFWHWSTGESMYHVGYADEVADIGHKGWYADDDGDETTRGVVLRIPTAKGTIYAPGYYNSGCDGHHADLTKSNCVLVSKGSGEADHTDAKKQVAWWADSMAEKAAEKEREYNQVYRAEQAVADAKEEVSNAAESARAVVAALREAKAALTGDTPTLCTLLRQSLIRAREALHDALRELADRRDVEAYIRECTGITEKTM